MRTTAIMNAKGGVGKTTTAINLAAELTARGKRVVLIDADPQCNLTDFYLQGREEGYTTLYDLLATQGEPYYASWILEAGKGLWLVPGSMDLILADVRALRDGTIRLTAIRELAECMAEDDFADVLLIDCPPSFTAAATAALAAADDVIIPVRVDAFSLHGMDELLRQVKGMRDVNRRLRLAGALVTMDRANTVVSKAARDALRESAVPVFKASVPFTEWCVRSTFEGKPLREMKNEYAQRAAAAYADVAEEYLKGGAGNG